MYLSYPKEYVDLLIRKIIDITQQSLSTYYQETYRGECSLGESQKNLLLAEEKVAFLREEIVMICESLEKFEGTREC